MNLDALERPPTRLPWFDASGELISDDPWLVTVPTERDAFWVAQVIDTLPALIQRVRVAEAGLAQAVALDFKRKGLLAEAQATIQIDQEIHAADIARIAQLERVREAAKELDSPCEHERGFCIAHGTVRLPCPVAELRAALTACESKSETVGDAPVTLINEEVRSR